MHKITVKVHPNPCHYLGKKLLRAACRGRMGVGRAKPKQFRIEYILRSDSSVCSLASHTQRKRTKTETKTDELTQNITHKQGRNSAIIARTIFDTELSHIFLMPKI